MKITIDTDLAILSCDDGKHGRIPLYSPEAFDVISRQWLKVGWDQKYTYTFTWLGRPVIQLPEDLMRVQEVLYKTKPDVLVETGVAHGGSLVFYASMFKVMGRGRVIGVDIHIRPQNRLAIEDHSLADWITLVEGDSVQDETVNHVKAQVRPGETVMVVLDSCHTYQHVMNELNAYHSLVTPGSFLVAADGVMKDLSDVPRGQASWIHDNPQAAIRDFAARHPEFQLEVPALPFNESPLQKGPTYWPGAWLRRLEST